MRKITFRNFPRNKSGGLFASILIGLLVVGLNLTYFSGTLHPLLSSCTDTGSGEQVYSPGNDKGRVAVLIAYTGSDPKSLGRFSRIGCHLTVAIPPFLDDSKECSRAVRENGLELALCLPAEKIRVSGANSPESSQSTPGDYITDAYLSMPGTAGLYVENQADAGPPEMDACIRTFIRATGLYAVLPPDIPLPDPAAGENNSPLFLYLSDNLDGSQPSGYLEKRILSAASHSSDGGGRIIVIRAGDSDISRVVQAISSALSHTDRQKFSFCHVSELITKKGL